MSTAFVIEGSNAKDQNSSDQASNTLQLKYGSEIHDASESSTQSFLVKKNHSSSIEGPRIKLLHSIYNSSLFSWLRNDPSACSADSKNELIRFKSIINSLDTDATQSIAKQPAYSFLFVSNKTKILSNSILLCLLILAWLSTKHSALSDYQLSLETIYCILHLFSAGLALVLVLPELVISTYQSVRDGQIKPVIADLMLLVISFANILYSFSLGMSELASLIPFVSPVLVALYIQLKQQLVESMLFRYLSMIQQMLIRRGIVCDTITTDKQGNLILEKFPLSDLRAGQVIKLTAGQECLVDGVILNGAAECLERVNGAPAALLAKSPGEKISSSTTLVTGTIDLEIESSYEDSSARIFEDRVSEQVYSEIKSLDSQANYLSATLALLFFLAFGASIWWFKSGLKIDQVSQIFASVLALSSFVWLWGYSYIIRAFFPISSFKFGVMTLHAKVLDILISIKTLCIDFTSRVPPGDGEIVELTILDNRVSQDAVERALFQLISATQEQWKQSLLNKIIERRSKQLVSPNKQGDLFSIDGVRSYRGIGVHALINSVEFSFGTEEFLITRGVNIDPGEVKYALSDQVVWYLAVNDELVARITVDVLGAEEQMHAFKNISDLGIQVRIASEEAAQVVDRYASRVGMERGLVHSGLDQAMYQNLLLDWAPCAVLMTQIPLAHHKLATCQIVAFDNLRWNLADSHLTLLARDPALVFRIFKLAYQEASKINNIRAACLVFGAVALSLAASSHMQAYPILLSLLLVTLYFSLTIKSDLKKSS